MQIQQCPFQTVRFVYVPVPSKVEGQVKSKCKMVEQKMLAVQGEGVLKASALFNSQRSEFM